jgi:hypothetical protein
VPINGHSAMLRPTTEMQGKDELEGLIRRAGVVMWSRLLACALLLVPAQALAGATAAVASA